MKILAKLVWYGINVITFILGVIAGITTTATAVGIAKLTNIGINMFPISTCLAFIIGCIVWIILRNKIVQWIYKQK